MCMVLANVLEELRGVKPQVFCPAVAHEEGLSWVEELGRAHRFVCGGHDEAGKQKQQEKNKKN